MSLFANVYWSNDMWMISWFIGSKCDQIINISLLLPSSFWCSPLTFFMKFLIFHCFYHYFSNQTFIVHIDDLMKMLIFCWFYHHYRIVQHLNSTSFWLLSLAVPQWAFSEPQWAPRTPQGHEMIPQGTPRDVQWVPKDAPRLYSYEILCWCLRLPLDHVKTTLYLGSGAGIIDITKSLFGVLRWDNNRPVFQGFV